MGSSNPVFRNNFKQEAVQGLLQENLCEGMRPTKMIVNEKPIFVEEMIYEAVPFILQEDGSIVNEVDPPADSRVQIKETSDYPNNCIGLVCGFSIDTFRYGTGCLIGPNIVLTCAHNCYDRQQKSQFKEIKFYPPINDGFQDGIKVKAVHYPDNFCTLPNKDIFQVDYAVLELTQELKETYGYLGMDFRQENITPETQVKICGYPHDKQRKTLWEAKGHCRVRDESFLQYNISVSKGQSGSPILKFDQNRNVYVIGVHSGAKKKENINIGILLNEEKRTQIKKWLNIGVLNLNGLHLGSKIQDLQHEDERWLSQIKQFYLVSNDIGLNEMKLFERNNIWSNIKILDLSKNRIEQKGVKYLKHFLSVVELNLNENQIGIKGIQSLAEIQFKCLSKLKLGGNKIGNKGLEYLNYFPHLSELILWKNEIDNIGTRILVNQELHSLQKLHLGQNFIQSLKYLKELKFLVSLNLWKNHLTEEALSSVQNHFPNLTILNLSLNNIGDYGIPFLQKLPKLRVLKLWKIGISLKGVQFFSKAKFQSLLEVDLSMNEIGEKANQILEKMRKQKKIKIAYSQIVQ